MAFKIIIKPIAYLDLEEAIDWYESETKGLGNHFLFELERCKNKIANNPQHYRIYHKDARRIILTKFPYKIFYRIREETVVVLGIHHGKRSKAFVNRRLKLP